MPADASFRTRLLSIDGATKTLVIASRPDSAGIGTSDKIVLFDLTSPAAPVYRTTIATANGPISGIWTANGWIYAITDLAFLTIDLHTTPPTVHVSADAPAAHNASVAVQGTWALVAGIASDNRSGEYDVYDVSDPAAPQLFSSTENGSALTRTTSLLPLRAPYFMVGSDGQNYIAARPP